MRIVIVGAGNVGRSIARELTAHGHQILLIDKNPKAMKPDTVPEAEWLCADACELATLEAVSYTHLTLPTIYSV